MAVYFESKKNKRRMNQDYHLYMEYRVNHEAMIRTMLVADGMGGLSCGETASRLAGQKWIMKLQHMTISENFIGKPLNEQIDKLKSFSYEVIQEINEEVYHELSNRGVTGGTTLTAAIFYWDTLILTNCGDSPAYYYSREDAGIFKLSKEQNAAEALVMEGKIEKASQEYWKHKNMLTDYIGKYRKAIPNVVMRKVKNGDSLFIGSDGAFGRLDEKQIQSILMKNEKKPQAVIKDILSLAEKMGEEDNQTLIYYIEEKEVGNEEKPKEKRGFFRKRQVAKS